jgi:hypothetical protein
VQQRQRFFLRGAAALVLAAAGCAATRVEWALVAPEASLFDKTGKQIAKHYAGPSLRAAHTADYFFCGPR